MKIAIIGTIASSVFGFREPLIKLLLSYGHHVFVFAIDYTQEQKKQLEEWGGVPIDYVLSRHGLNPIVDIKMMFTLKNKLQNIQPDIVLSYFVKPVVYGTLAAKLAKVPKRIAMLEGLGFAFTNQPEGITFKTNIIQIIQKLLYKLAFPATTDLIFLNSDDRDELLVSHKLKANNVFILGGIGLELKDYPYQKPRMGKICFLYIGRLLKEKGVFDFLSAAEIVKKQFPYVEFVVLGGGDSTSPNAISQEQLNDVIKHGLVTYPGQVSNVVDWITESSVFVLPSYREGVPRSSQEAMAVGRPILTTDVPGCRETVEDGSNGFKVPVADVKALVEKMFWFIENPDQIKPMGLASRKMAEEKFDVHKINKEMLKIMGIK